MGAKRPSSGLARPGAILLGLAVGALLVVANGLTTFEFFPGSQERFTWQAYAETVYTDTPTVTPTETPTATPTQTPTSTPSDREDSAGDPACNDGIDNDFDTLVDCADSDCAGISPCASPAPATSDRTLMFIALLLFAVGFFALTPLGGRKKQ